MIVLYLRCSMHKLQYTSISCLLYTGTEPPEHEISIYKVINHTMYEFDDTSDEAINLAANVVANTYITETLFLFFCTKQK